MIKLSIYIAMPSSRPVLPRIRRMHPNPPERFSDSTIPHLIQNLSGIDPGDGVYVCSCLRENQLFLFDGDHPLGNVSCKSCDKIPHSTSKLSDVFTPIFDFASRYAAVPFWTDMKKYPVPYGFICTSCGLTHRAVLKGTKTDEGGVTKAILDFNPSACACGDEATDGRVGFYIGSPEKYHRDPNSVHGEISIRNAEFACGQYARRHPPIMPLDHIPMCVYKVAKAPSRTMSVKMLGGIVTSFSRKTREKEIVTQP